MADKKPKSPVERDREAAIQRGREGRAQAQNTQRQAPPPKLPAPPANQRPGAVRDSPAGPVVESLPGAKLLMRAKKFLDGI